jgi:outer membrane protein OmpA-like peptidoglycan-associated protein
MLILLALASTSHAEDVVVGGAPPAFNAQFFRPSVDSEAFVRTDTSLVHDGFGWRSTGSWSWAPVAWTNAHGDRTVILEHILQDDIGLTWGFGAVQAGVNVPVVLRAFGGDLPEATGIGDATVDLKVPLLDRTDGGAGLAVIGRGLLPTSQVGRPLSGPLGGEAEVVADLAMGATTWALNGSAVFQDTPDLENAVWGRHLRYGAAANVRLSPDNALFAEFNGMRQLGNGDNPYARGAEAMVGGQFYLGSGVALRHAAGMGIGEGVGSAKLRGTVALVSVPRAAPAAPPVKETDRDGDGLLDRVDACPDQPEDKDAWVDEDGCPEPTDVTVRLVDSDGVAVAPTPWTARDVRGSTGTVAKLPAGPATFQVAGVERAATIPAGPPTEVVLTVPAPRGSLVVSVVDAKGAAVPGASWSCEGPTKLSGQASGTFPVRPGDYTLSATAPGYRKGTVSKTVQRDGTLAVVLTLEPAKAALTGARIDIKDSVYFETNKAVIKPESFGLLDEIATILAEHPELTRVRVEGNTDSRGDNAANKTLSQARAESVVAYFVGKGIAATRLEAIGHGEEKPLVKNEKTDADRAKNRRVDFFIVARSDDAAAPK